MMLRAVVAVICMVLLCTACGGDPVAPAAPPEPLSWTPGFKSPRHQVLTLVRGQPPVPVLMVAFDNTLRLQSIMGSTLILADMTSGAQAGVLAPAATGDLTLGETVLPAGSLVVLRLEGGQLTGTTATATIEGKTEKELQYLLQ
jgi:hypothetical protein